MEAIFGNSMATGNFAKDSSAALGAGNDDGESHEEDDDVSGHGPNIQGATSSSTKSSKKTKLAEIEDDGFVAAFKSIGESLVCHQNGC